LFIVFGVSIFRSRPKLVLVSALLLFVFLSLPLIHNYVYGHKLVLLTTSADIRQNLKLPPKQLARIFVDPKVIGRAWSQIKFLVGFVDGNYLDTSIPMWGLLLLWLGIGVKWFSSRKNNKLLAGLLLMLPILFLGVQFFFILNVSYPRHLVAGYEVMGMVCLFGAGAGRFSLLS
jgi:hypothetical protein